MNRNRLPRKFLLPVYKYTHAYSSTVVHPLECKFVYRLQQHVLFAAKFSLQRSTINTVVEPLVSYSHGMRELAPVIVSHHRLLERF